MTVDPWVIRNHRHDPHSLGQHNSVFTVSNGYLGLKGTVAEDRDGYQPVTLINGVYDELNMFSLIRASNQERRYLDATKFDTAGKSPCVANLPSPLFVRLYVCNRELSLSRGTVSDFEQTLDLRTGLYRYAFALRNEDGRTTHVEMERFASAIHPHRVFMRYGFRAVDYSGRVCVLSGIDATTRSNTTGEKQYEVVRLDADDSGLCSAHVRTPARGHDVFLRVAGVLNGAPAARGHGVVEHDRVYTMFELAVQPGQMVTMDRVIVIGSSEDARQEVVADPDGELAAATEQGYDAALAAQKTPWAERWDRACVAIEGDVRAQQYLNFCLYHLLAAAPRHTDRLSVPVKLLTGEYYQGNTFYDTDVYIVPYFVFTQPEVARSCLHWRYLGLEPGRNIARDLGYRGAKLAWQAGPYGEECLGDWWRFVHTNIHINADAAYGLMQYYWATGDEEFMRRCGVEMLVEFARFYASRAVYDASRDAYDLADVAGPDEGHCESTNNFFTNYLAIRTLRWAGQMLARLKRSAPDVFAETIDRLNVEDHEPSRWQHVADRLTVLFDAKTKLYEQCDGFYDLETLPPHLSRDRKVWFETVFPYQALNQPDVVMAMVMFRDEFDRDVQRVNWEFYKDKSMNFSSMSFVLNSIMAADMGEKERAYEEFLIAAGMDVDEELTGRKDTFAGLHGTSAGGAWMAAVFGFGGVCLSEQGLRIRPNLPPAWNGLRFPLLYQGLRLNVAIDREQVTIRAAGDASRIVALNVGDETVTLSGGATRAVSYKPQ